MWPDRAQKEGQTVRCSVCGRRESTHRRGVYQLRQNGKVITNSGETTRCACVRAWQSMLIGGSMQGYRMSITKAKEVQLMPKADKASHG